MTYELAKQLKDAGFPKPKTGDYAEMTEELYRNKSECVFPTLSELIEACGEKFGSLDRDIDYETGKLKEWRATGTDGMEIDLGEDGKTNCDPNCCGYEVGSTPEEAVAKLWLELNRKV